MRRVELAKIAISGVGRGYGGNVHAMKRAERSHRLSRCMSSIGSTCLEKNECNTQSVKL